MTPFEMIAEWKRGCSCASISKPEECSECTRALIDAMERSLVEKIPTVDSSVQIVNRAARVTRLTTGHGSSELGIEVTLNALGAADFPGLIEGETLQVQIQRIKSGGASQS